MPLKLAQFKDPAVLNRWADGIEQRLDAIPPPKPVPKPVQFKTNSVSNKSQGILNLIAGNNITLTPDLFGNTIVAASTGGPNLALGDPIDFPQIDPASFILVDDFSIGTAATTRIGSLGWASAATGTAAAITVNQFTIPNIGGIRLASGTSTNGILQLGLSAIQIGGANIYNEALAILDYPGWKIVFNFIPLRAAYGSAAGSFDWKLKQSFYIGLSLNEQAATGRPSIFAGLRLDTDTTAPSIGDSTFWFECVSNPASGARNNTQGNAHNTGVTPVEFQEYRLEITCTVAGKFNFSLNGSTPVTLNMPTYTVGGGSGSSTISNNIASINYVGGTSAISAFGNGSKITVAGLTGTHAVLNGSQIVLQGSQNANSFHSGTTTLASQNDPITAVGFPALCPFIQSGNDSSATPTSKQVGIDFFLLLYNPKLAASFAGTASNPLLPRYYIAQT